jgi:hypothetical protein
MSVGRLTRVAFAIASLWSVAVRADSADDATGAEPIAVRAPAIDNAFTPALRNSEGHGRAVVSAIGGWNGAAHKTTLDLGGEVQVFGPVRLVLRVDSALSAGDGSRDQKARPGIGAAVQFLDERKHGVSSSAYFVYRAEGFTEGEGELEGLVAFGKQLGPVHGTLNLAYGQDPEGAERDGEIAIGLHVEPIRGLLTGVIGRYRDALGSHGDRSTKIVRDMLGGASATYLISNFAVSATAGIAGIEVFNTGSFQTGAQAGLSLGAVF